MLIVDFTDLVLGPRLESVQVCCNIGPATAVSKVKVLEVLEDHCVAEVFGHKVCSVGLPRYLDQGHQLLSCLLLKPKAADIDMSNFGNSLSIQYSLGSCGVQLQSNIQIQTDAMAQRAD